VNKIVAEFQIDEVEVGVKEDSTEITKFNQYR